MEPLFSSEELRRLERAHPEGLPAAAIVELLRARGVVLAEATFRKYVQLGLLPPSRRVGRKGKHKGSHGLYPAALVGRLAEIRALMDAGLTLEEIRRSHVRFGQDIDALRRGAEALLAGLTDELASRGEVTGAAAAKLKRLKAQADALSDAFTGAVEELLPARPSHAPEPDAAQIARDAEASLSGRRPARPSAAARLGHDRSPPRASNRRGADE